MTVLKVVLSVISVVNAFTPALNNGHSSFAPLQETLSTQAGAQPVDKSVKGIDKPGSYDPTDGDSAALSRNNKGEVWNQQRARPRRNRKSAAMRSMVRECIVTPSNFIYPLFIHDEDFNTVIPSMPGCERHSLDSMLKEVGESIDVGVNAFVLFS